MKPTDEQVQAVQQAVAAWLEELLTREMVHRVMIDMPDFATVPHAEFWQLVKAMEAGKWTVSVTWEAA